MQEDKEEVRKFKCEHCGKAEFETAMQLRGHQMSCRPTRVPFGVPEKRFEDVASDDGFHYRIFNSNWRKDPTRIERAKRAGYEVVDHVDSGRTVGTNDDGSEIKGVLMRIPKEFWEQDQKLKEEGRSVIDEQIRGGKYLSKPGDGRYTPREGIRMETKLTP